MFKKFVILFIILCSLLFFEFTFLGRYAKLFELMGIGLVVVLIVLYGIYDNSFRFKHNFIPQMIIILLSLPFSMYVASKFHNQDLSVSLYAQRSIYYYLLYFALHQIKINPKDFEKLFIYFAVAYVIFYLLQYALYPGKIIFNCRISEERGTLRIFIAGLPYLIICYFLSLQYVLERFKLKYIVFYSVTLIIMILLGSRGLLFALAISTIINLLFSKRIKSKVLIYLLGAIGVTLIYIAFQNIFQGLISATTEKELNLSDNIRIRAARYYLTKFFPDPLAYIFGNGASSARSDYSNRLVMISSKYGYFLSDIGILGNYIKYGILFVLGVIGIIYKSLRIKIQPQFKYIKYFYTLNALCFVLGGGFADSDFIVLVCITLYMLDVSKFYTEQKDIQKDIQSVNNNT
jgi:hypothetical protein